MNTLQIRKVLTKHVKYFQGVYPIGLLPSTLIKPLIIVINLDKHYIPGSHWVAVCFSDSGYPEYLIRTACRLSSMKSQHTCNATQFLGHLTATDYRA
jgi:hypothetical protein